MPVLDEAAYLGKRAGSSQPTLSAEKSSKPTTSAASLKLPNGVAKPPAAPLVDLLDLSSDDAPVLPSAPNDFLNDLLGIGLPNSSSSGFILPYSAFFSFYLWTFLCMYKNEIMTIRMLDANYSKILLV